MADAIVSALSQRIRAIIEDEVNLLTGVEDELNRIRYVLENAEPRRFKEKPINDWLVRLEDTAHEMEDVLDEWDYYNLKIQAEKSYLAAAWYKGYLGSNGEMEFKGREYFDILAMHSLFQDFEKSEDGQIKRCKMHDIVHDFVQFLKNNGRLEVAGTKRTACQTCNPSLVSSTKKYRTLFCDNDQSPQHLCDCLVSLRVLKLERFPQGMEKLIHLKWLKLNYTELTLRDLKIIFQLYNLQTLLLDMCALEESPSEIGNLISLRKLEIFNYRGSKLPGWIASPLNQLRKIRLSVFWKLLSLPPLGKLPCLEHLEMSFMQELPFVGQEFLGITRGGGGVDIKESSSSSVAFPKLKTLKFWGSRIWKEWEDITVEEEDSAAMSIMPCLTELIVINCFKLKELPHRLLQKAVSLELLDISCSKYLIERYMDKDGSAWKAISQNNPRLRLEVGDY